MMHLLQYYHLGKSFDVQSSVGVQVHELQLHIFILFHKVRLKGIPCCHSL